MHSLSSLNISNKPKPNNEQSAYRSWIFKNQNNPLKIMDQMDIDPIVDVPDTPDRLTVQNKNGKSSLEKGSNLSMSGPSEPCNLFDNEARDGLKFNDKGSRKSLIHAPKNVVSSNISDHNRNLAFASEKSSSSNNSIIFRRRLANEFPSYENNHVQRIRNDKLLYTQSSARQDGSVLDLKEKNGNGGANKNLLSTNRLPSSHMIPNSSMASCGTNKCKEPNGSFSALDSGNVIESSTETHSKTGKVVSTSLNSFSSPRVTGQRRLVRNGCISPHNIEKAKHVVGKDKNGVIDSGLNCTLPVLSSGPQIGIDVREAVAEGHDSHTLKGKGIMPHPLLVKQPDIQSTHNRNTVSINEVVKEVGNSNEDTLRGFEELGWRSTRNRSKKMNLPSSDEHRHHRERIDPCFVSQLPGKRVTRGKIGTGAGISYNYPTDQDSTSTQSDSRSLPRQRVPNIRSQGHRATTNMFTKRQKQGSSSSQGECSGAALDDSDILFLGSPGDISESRSTQTQSRNGLGILGPVIEIDEASPEVRVNGSSSAGCSSNTGDAMVRQIEADEILARELQEQFYNEVPNVGVSEIDAHVALALQHEQNSPRAFSRRSQHVFSRGNPLTANSNRQSQSRSPLLSRRGPQARGPTLSRMTRLRNRFPGQPRTISSSRERNSLFPADMDVDMRMHILEALEAFSDMGVDNNLLQIHREFNENDYEMLLSLDENNDQHGGASTSHINSLPQSTVQSDNLEEACAICLETPTMGDIIRHLPCLHKFHKDCIDPWLRRRTSCPVCKSSIT